MPGRICLRTILQTTGDRLGRLPEGTFGHRDLIPQGFSGASIRLCKDPLFSFLSPVSQSPSRVTSALGTHTLRVTKPVCGKERTLG